MPSPAHPEADRHRQAQERRARDDEREHGGNQVDFLFPEFDTVKLGWQLYQPNEGSYDIWMDDIALGTKRIGC